MLFLMTVQDTVQKDKIIYIYQSQYSGMAYTVSKYLHGREDIEDTVHDSMLKLMTIIDRIEIEDPVRLKNLCCVVARNMAINRAKSRKGGVVGIDELYNTQDPFSLDPSDVAEERELLSRLEKAIASLGEIYRDVCRLKYINELKEKEIAQLLDLPLKTVNQRIFRGKQVLKKALWEN